MQTPVSSIAGVSSSIPDASTACISTARCSTIAPSSRSSLAPASTTGYSTTLQYSSLCNTCENA
eukprot:815225-Rhodomonas_salina.1